MIKVLNVVVDNHIGGIQNRLLSIGKDLEKQGVQIIITSPNGDGDFAEISRENGYKVHQASIGAPKHFKSVKNTIKNALWILKFPIGVIEIIRIIKYENADCVHAHGLLALHAVFAAKITRRPLVWHLIGTLYPGSLVKIIRPLFSWNAIIILPTNKTKKYYLGSQFENYKVKIIFEPVDIRVYQKTQKIKEENESIRSMYHIPLDAYVVGFIGNISPIKGLEFFLDVAKHLKDRSATRVCFVIVGKAQKGHEEYLAKLESIIDNFDLKDYVFILGHCRDAPQCRRMYSIMDIFLMTSISEGTPLVILEAMAMEIPVIAPDVGGISEQISDEETGFVVTPKDIDTIIQNIQVLLSNPNKRETMGRMGRERVNSLFSLERCVQHHLEIYSETVNDRK